MKLHRRVLSALLAALLLAPVAALTGCGDDDDLPGVDSGAPDTGTDTDTSDTPDAGSPDTTDADDAADTPPDDLAIDAASLRDNPNNTLSTFLTLQTPEPTFVEVTADSGEHEFTLDFDDEQLAKRDQLLIGFRPEQTYTLTVTAYTSGFEAAGTETLEFTTGSLPDDFPRMEVTESQPDRMQPGITIFNVWRWNPDMEADYGYIVGLDAAGEVVWYYRPTHRPASVILLDNGNLAYNWGTGRIVEIDLAGNKVNTWRWDELGITAIHHNVRELPNGNLLTFSAELRQISGYTDEAGNPATYNVVGDVIVEFTRDGEVVHQHSLLDVLDPHNTTPSFHSGYWDGWFSQYAPTKDWTHSNSVVYDAADDTFVVSIRHLNMIAKIDRETGDLVWRLGDGYDFELLSGEWFYHTHEVEVLENGNLIMYDNGNDRPGLIRGEFFSRAVEYAVDEDAMTAEQVWEYRGDEPFYSGFLSDADRLENGNVLIDDGGRFENLGEENELAFARIVEVTGDEANDVVFEVYLRGAEGSQVGYSSYTAERMDLFEALDGAKIEKSQGDDDDDDDDDGGGGGYSEENPSTDN